MLLRRLTGFLLVAVFLIASPLKAATPNGSSTRSLLKDPAVQAFIDSLVTQEGFNRNRLEDEFRRVKLQPEVIAAITHPAEALPWYKYRRIFLTEKRITAGVRFWNVHKAALMRAQATYGVPPQIVTAIIGVETFYGRHMGRWPVFDSLATLAFDYPPRARFFRGQLKQFLLLARSEGIDPFSVKGSYAGAMGLGQFMPGSYRAYAIDFNADDKKDLWNDPADAIGSVANYLAKHGWKRNAGVAVPARVEGDPYARRRPSAKPSLYLRQLAAEGIEPMTRPAGGGPYSVIRLINSDGQPEYWLGGPNFYVIMRYNYSPLYAMAVYQLSQKIKQAYAETHGHRKT